jgi:hypothetical protein
LGKALLKPEQLGTRCKQSPLETSSFRIQFLQLKIPKGNVLLLLKVDHHLPLGDAGCHGHPLKNPLLPGGGSSVLSQGRLGGVEYHGKRLTGECPGGQRGMNLSEGNWPEFQRREKSGNLIGNLYCY